MKKYSIIAVLQTILFGTIAFANEKEFSVALDVPILMKDKNQSVILVSSADNFVKSFGRLKEPFNLYNLNRIKKPSQSELQSRKEGINRDFEVSLDGKQLFFPGGVLNIDSGKKTLLASDELELKKNNIYFSRSAHPVVGGRYTLNRPHCTFQKVNGEVLTFKFNRSLSAEDITKSEDFVTYANWTHSQITPHWYTFPSGMSRLDSEIYSWAMATSIDGRFGVCKVRDHYMFSSVNVVVSLEDGSINSISNEISNYDTDSTRARIYQIKTTQIGLNASVLLDSGVPRYVVVIGSRGDIVSDSPYPFENHFDIGINDLKTGKDYRINGYYLTRKYKMHPSIGDLYVYNGPDDRSIVMLGNDVSVATLNIADLISTVENSNLKQDSLIKIRICDLYNFANAWEQFLTDLSNKKEGERIPPKYGYSTIREFDIFLKQQKCQEASSLDFYTGERQKYMK